MKKNDWSEQDNPNCIALLDPDTGRLRCTRSYGEWHVRSKKTHSFDGIAKAVVEDIGRCLFGQSPWPLVLIGQAGTGKTCAALCVLDRVGGTYQELRDLADLVNRARTGELYYEGANGRRVYPQDVWDSWERSNVTVLDEIAIRTPTDAQYETIKRALDLREEKPSIVICNIALDQLFEAYDDRIVSRLSAGTIVNMPKKDRR